MLSKDSYFMRVFYWDWDEEGIAPVYIKIPLTLLSPSPSMLSLLTALEDFYDADCYLAIDDICESSGDQIGLIPFGITTSKAMIVTTPLGDGQAEELLCGITSVVGEYTLIAIDRESGCFAGLVVNQTLADYLGLEYIEQATDLHQRFLESIGCFGEKEFVYYPSALYD